MQKILRTGPFLGGFVWLVLLGGSILQAGPVSEGVATPSRLLAIGDFWQRWEYLAGVMLLVAFGMAGLYGYRLRRGMATTMEANRKNLETIQASEQRFRSLSSASPIGIFQADMADKFVYTNRQWEEITGLGTPGLVGEAWRQLIHPEDLDRFQAAWLEMRQQRRDLNFESRLRTKGLGMRWVSIRAHPLPDTQECVGTMEDITTRKGAEAALQRTARDLESLYNQSPCGYHSLNHQGIITRINDTELSWLGYQREEVVRHKRFADILTSASRVQFEEQFGMFHVVNRGTSLEFELVRKDGTGLPVLMNASVIKDPSGALAALHCTVFDISERKRFELELTAARDAALQSARYKSEFLATMSHEIRTPMNGVIGMTGLLQGTPLTAEQMDYVSTIRSSSDSLLAIINDILDFSKIEAGKLTFEVLDFDLADVVDSTLDLLAEKAHAKRLELAGFIAPEVATLLRGDADRLRQVLTNLVSNAVKFTSEGEVVVWVGREMETETHTRLRFEIKDSGIGIAPEAQARLFQPFQQADNSMSRKYGGTGLGLAICRQLVTMMQGDIGVDSEPGRGSSFWFTVNLEKQPVPSALPGLNSPLENRRVLVVDDNEASRLILKHQLEKWCSRVEVAGGGEEALVKLRTAGLKGERFHIVIADLQMPGMDGLALAAQIKADPSGARCRVLLLVSVTEKPAAAALQQAGVETCLTKPVRQSRLHDAIAASLAGENSTQVVAKRALKELPPPAEPAASKRKPRILLVEDNPINQRVALGLLGRLGTRADTAGNGIEALDILRHAPYDVILMDCQMPEMDGFEATLRIRQMEAERERGQEVPLASRAPLHIIALTANAMQGDRDRCLASGMNDYLSKPVKADDLVRALERCPLLDPVPAAVAASPEPEPAPEAPAPAPSQAIPAPPLPVATGEPAPAPGPEEEMVDLGRITDLTDGSIDEIRELVDLYMNQADELSVKLEAVVAANNSREVTQVAHKWCGASSTCGITGLVECLRELERMGRAGDLTGAGELVAKAKARLDRIRAFWAEYFRSKQNG